MDGPVQERRPLTDTKSFALRNIPHILKPAMIERNPEFASAVQIRPKRFERLEPAALAACQLGFFGFPLEPEVREELVHSFVDREIKKQVAVSAQPSRQRWVAATSTY